MKSLYSKVSSIGLKYFSKRILRVSLPSSPGCQYSGVNDTDVCDATGGGEGCRRVRPWAIFPGSRDNEVPGNNYTRVAHRTPRNIRRIRLTGTPRDAADEEERQDPHVASVPEEEAWRRRHVLILEFVEARGHARREEGDGEALFSTLVLPASHEEIVRACERLRETPRSSISFSSSPPRATKTQLQKPHLFFFSTFHTREREPSPTAETPRPAAHVS